MSLRFKGARNALVVMVAGHLGLASAPARGANEEKTEMVEAGARYGASWPTRLFLGWQWRELWTTPIEVPVLDLGRFDGGLVPNREGGGQQTKNLHLKSGNDHRWVFRSVDKDPTRILAPEVRQSLLGDIAQDLTSTVNPGGALVVAPLLDTAGVLHATPTLFVMPADPRLGEFSEKFAGVLGMLESRDERDLPGVDKVLTTFELFARLEAGHDEHVDARDYLRARLIDILVGDWDRHDQQWRWVRVKEEGIRLWRPVPRDRDQAFSRFTGILPSIAEYYTKQLASFGAAYPSIEKLTFSGRYVDRRFLVGLEKPDWEAVTAELMARLSNAAITDAVRHLPKEWYAKAGEEVTRMLLARRDRLPQASEEFYRLLAKIVDVRGTEMADAADILRLSDGSVKMSLYPRDEKSGARLGPAFFHRTFKPDETEEVRLYLLGGKDRAEVQGPPATGIHVRIVAPGGEAELVDRSGCCISFHHLGDALAGPSGGSARFATPRDWGHDLLFFPQLTFDGTRGLVAGASASLTDFGFELAPYSNHMSFGAAYSTGTNQPRITYAGDFRTRSPIAILFSAGYSGMDQVNFFGLGNETTRNAALAGSGFYRVSQKVLLLHPSIDFSASGPVRSRIGVLLKHVSNVESAPIASTGISGFSAGTIGAAEASLVFDGTSGSFISERGLALSLSGRYYPRLLDNADAFEKVRAEAAAFLGGHLLADVVLALRVAGEKIWGSYPFYEAAFIGGIPGAAGFDPVLANGNLMRGHDLNRFAGDASLVGNAELRVAIGSYNSILPTRYGVLGLADAGRVFRASESSTRWHTGLGGGLWATILAAVPGYELSTTISALVVRSDESTSFYFASGFGF